MVHELILWCTVQFKHVSAGKMSDLEEGIALNLDGIPSLLNVRPRANIESKSNLIRRTYLF